MASTSDCDIKVHQIVVLFESHALYLHMTWLAKSGQYVWHNKSYIFSTKWRKNVIRITYTTFIDIITFARFTKKLINAFAILSTVISLIDVTSNVENLCHLNMRLNRRRNLRKHVLSSAFSEVYFVITAYKWILLTAAWSAILNLRELQKYKIKSPQTFFKSGNVCYHRCWRLLLYS